MAPDERQGYVLHYRCTSGDHYYRELNDDLTVEELEYLVGGDAMTAEMLLRDPIEEVETIEVAALDGKSIPEAHPDWEKFLGEKWKIEETP
jgi:hypothetical protein